MTIYWGSPCGLEILIKILTKSTYNYLYIEGIYADNQLLLIFP